MTEKNDKNFLKKHKKYLNEKSNVILIGSFNLGKYLAFAE